MIKIERVNKTINCVALDTLDDGQLFEYGSRLFIKINSNYPEEDNAFDLEYSMTTILGDSTQVIPRNGKLTVEE